MVMNVENTGDSLNPVIAVGNNRMLLRTASSDSELCTQTKMVTFSVHFNKRLKVNPCVRLEYDGGIFSFVFKH